MIAEIDKRQPRLPMLYILLGASLVVLFVGLILLIVSSCGFPYCHSFQNHFSHQSRNYIPYAHGRIETSVVLG